MPGSRVRSRRAARLGAGALRRGARAARLGRAARGRRGRIDRIRRDPAFGRGLRDRHAGDRGHARVRAPAGLARRSVARRSRVLRSQRLGEFAVRRVRGDRGAEVIVLLRAGADVAAARAVEAALQRAGAGARRVNGGGRLAVESVAPHAPLGDETRARLAALDGVEAVLDGAEPNPRVRAARGPVEIATPLGPLEIGGAAVALAFGPCSVDDEDDLWKTASAARAAGAQLLRGGAFKPRTSPYAFQGAGAGALRLLRRAGDAFGLAVVSEAMSEASLDAVAAECELVQLGARSMACTPLLKAAARCGRPLLLKRGFGATVDEWLAAAEYL